MTTPIAPVTAPPSAAPAAPSPPAAPASVPDAAPDLVALAIAQLDAADAPSGTPPAEVPPADAPPAETAPTEVPPAAPEIEPIPSLEDLEKQLQARTAERQAALYHAELQRKAQQWDAHEKANGKAIAIEDLVRDPHGTLLRAGVDIEHILRATSAMVLDPAKAAVDQRVAQVERENAQLKQWVEEQRQAQQRSQIEDHFDAIATADAARRPHVAGLSRAQRVSQAWELAAEYSARGFTFRDDAHLADALEAQLRQRNSAAPPAAAAGTNTQTAAAASTPGQAAPPKATAPTLTHDLAASTTQRALESDEERVAAAIAFLDAAKRSASATP
jgi:hypothetical protein